MFNENWMNELEFHKNTIPFSITTLKFGDKEIIVPNVSSLAIKFVTYSNGYGLVFGAYVEDRDFISKIAELSISADEMETIKTSTKITHKGFRQAIQNKFNLDIIVWNIKNSLEIQFILKNPHQDNHFDCIQIMQDIFNQITS
jgi:hypothetical protein